MSVVQPMSVTSAAPSPTATLARTAANMPTSSPTSNPTAPPPTIRPRPPANGSRGGG